MLIIYLIIIFVIGCIWGYAVDSIVKNKGYDENWFWWGFFFGIIPLLLALAKPDVNTPAYVGYYDRSEKQEKEMLSHGGWKCSCGRVNAAYTGTCGCGKAREEAKPAPNPAEIKKDTTDEIKKYKELLDMGAITKEEYEAKKKQLLNL